MHLTALHGEQPAFDWEEEFKSRMRAAQVVHRSNQRPRTTKSALNRPATRSITAQISRKRASEIQIMLRTLLWVLTTCLPFPPTTTIAFGPIPNSDPGTPPKYPAFPPLVLLLSSTFCTASNKGHFLRVFESASLRWLEDVLSHGFPRVLTRRLLADPSLLEVERGGDDIADEGKLFEAPVEQESKEWGKSEEAKMFYKLVAHTGFIPVGVSAQGVEASQKSAVVDDDDDDISEDADMYFTPNNSPPSGSDGPLPQITPLTTQPQDTSADAQFASARRMARRIVYDLRFLKPEKMFGPFMPQPTAEKMDGREGSSRKTRKSQADDDNESDDPDYVFAGTDSDSDSNTENDAESSANEHYGLFPLINLITPQDPDPVPAGTRLPSPDTLVPDWTWLAGARIIVEANLRDMLKRSSTVDTGSEGAEAGMEDVANALRKMEGLRMGGAPGFWDDGWLVWDKAPGYADSKVDEKGKGKAEEMYEGEEEAEQGWDWAGAAGTWR